MNESFTLVCQEVPRQPGLSGHGHCLRKLGQWSNPGLLYAKQAASIYIRSDLGSKTLDKEVLSEPFCADIGYTKGLVIIETSHRGVLHNNLLWHISKQM